MMRAILLAFCIAIQFSNAANSATTVGPQTTGAPSPARPPELIHESAGSATASPTTAVGEMSWKIIASKITGKINFTYSQPINGRQYMSLGFGSPDMMNMYSISACATCNPQVIQDYFNGYDDCVRCNIAPGSISRISRTTTGGRETFFFERPLTVAGFHDFSTLFDPPADPCNPSAPTITGSWVVGDRDGPAKVGEHSANCRGVPNNQCFGSGGGVSMAFQDPNLRVDPTAVTKFIPRTQMGSTGVWLRVEQTQAMMTWYLEGPDTDYWSVAIGSTMSLADGLAYTSGVPGQTACPSPNVCEYYYKGIAASDCVIHTTQEWNITNATAIGGVFYITASRPLTTVTPVTAPAIRKDVLFNDPTMTVIWTKMPGLPMINHGPDPATRNVAIMGFGQRLANGNTIQPASASIDPACLTGGGGGGGGGAQTAAGRFVVAGGLFEFAQTLSADKQSIELEMIGPQDRYFSVGWNFANSLPSSTMVNGDAIAYATTAAGGQVMFRNYWMTGTSPSCCAEDTGANPWTVQPVTTSGGKVTVRASRPLRTPNTALDFQFDVASPDIALLWAIGDKAGTTSMANHGGLNRGSFAFNFVSGGSAAVVEPSLYTNEEHASVMMISFLVLIPLGFVSHRHQWVSCLAMRAPAGQQLHRIAMSLAILLAWCGLLIQLGQFQQFMGRTWHGVFGLIMIICVTLQGIYGMTGYYGKHDAFGVHRLFGLILIVCGFVTAAAGALVFGNTIFSVFVFILLAFWVVVMLSLECMGRDKRGYMKNDTWVLFDRRNDPPAELEKVAMAKFDASKPQVEGVASTSTGTEGRAAPSGYTRPQPPPSVPR